MSSHLSRDDRFAEDLRSAFPLAMPEELAEEHVAAMMAEAQILAEHGATPALSGRRQAARERLQTRRRRSMRGRVLRRVISVAAGLALSLGGLAMAGALTGGEDPGDDDQATVASTEDSADVEESEDVDEAEDADDQAEDADDQANDADDDSDHDADDQGEDADDQGGDADDDSDDDADDPGEDGDEGEDGDDEGDVPDDKSDQGEDADDDSDDESDDDSDDDSDSDWDDGGDGDD